ncbi:MAG: replicative DNA helicase, partial [Erysipelotrichaceae bacterium]|nr:replicative DNA helicase [Erysipelotrichaceae bacterium]
MPKVMPSAVEVEQSLLGTLLLYPSAPRIAMEEDLSEDDFYVEAHRRIFMAMEELYQSGQPVDITTLSTRLNDRGQLNQVGGIEYLMQLSDAAVTSANTKAYVELLQGKKFLRRMIEVTSDISDRGFEGQVDVDEYIDEAERQVLAITRNRKASAFKSSNQVINEVIENIQKMADNRTEVTGIATGYNDLDHVTHGFQRSDLIIMAARPAMG